MIEDLTEVPTSLPGSVPSLVEAAAWLQGVLLGSLATAVAVIAVASIGYLMLLGRVDIRRGATVIIGCFILFGAPTIATGLIELAGQITGTSEASPSAPVTMLEPAASLQRERGPYDPYAGAAVQ